MALVCAQFGLRFIAILPEGVSNERALMIRAYGGTIHFSSKDAGIEGCIRESERLAAEIGAFLPRQFSNPENVEAQARAAGACAMPYTATASFDTAGKTMMGLAPAELAALTQTFDPRPVAFGANCGVGAADLVMSVLAMTQARPEAAVIAKANAGIPQWRGADIHYSGTPEVMAGYARLAIDAGARIVGGCCGSTAAHVAAMRRAIDRHEVGARPQLADVVAALGLLAAPRPTAAGRTRARRRGSPAP